MLQMDRAYIQRLLHEDMNNNGTANTANLVNNSMHNGINNVNVNGSGHSHHSNDMRIANLSSLLSQINRTTSNVNPAPTNNLAAFSLGNNTQGFNTPSSLLLAEYIRHQELLQYQQEQNLQQLLLQQRLLEEQQQQQHHHQNQQQNRHQNQHSLLHNAAGSSNANVGATNNPFALDYATMMSTSNYNGLNALTNTSQNSQHQHQHQKSSALYSFLTNTSGADVGGNIGALIPGESLDTKILLQRQKQTTSVIPSALATTTPASELWAAGASDKDPYAESGILGPWSATSAGLLDNMSLNNTKVKGKKVRKAKDKPKRPLSAYNIFFKEERARILSEIPSNTDDGDNASTTVTNNAVVTPPQTSATTPTTSEDTNNSATLPKSESDRCKKKRPHGKIGFESLAKVIGQRWQNLESGKADYYKALASEDMKRYKAEMDLYVAKQNKIVDDTVTVLGCKSINSSDDDGEDIDNGSDNNSDCKTPVSKKAKTT